MATKYRAENLGSFLRPAELLAARAEPTFAYEDMRALEDRCILDCLQRQQRAGLRIFSDGEFRRRSFMSDFNESVAGLDNETGIERTWQAGASGASAAAVLGVAVNKITPRKRMTDYEAGFLKQHSPGDFKITLPSANQFPAIAFKRGVTDSVYKTHSDLLWDVVPIIRDEIKALVDDGVRYVQIDAPRYSYFVDPKWREYVRTEMAMDPDEALDEAVRADNACIAGARREGVTIAIHLCRGNNRSSWYAEGGYEPIAEKAFGGLDADCFLLEYESERAGGFEPLRFVPRGKTVVLGLVSSKLPALESADELTRRIEEASLYVPLEDLALSTQCGFASTMEGNLLGEDEQWRKIDLVVETARRVWGSA